MPLLERLPILYPSITGDSEYKISAIFLSTIQVASAIWSVTKSSSEAIVIPSVQTQYFVPFGIRIDRLSVIGSPYVVISGRVTFEIKVDKHGIGGAAENGVGTVTGELLRFRIGSVVAAEEYRNIHIQIISGTLNFFPHISFHAGRENVGLVFEKGTTGTVGALHRSRDIRPQIIEIGFGDNRIGGLNRYAEQTTQTKG